MLVTNGGKQAVYQAFATLLDPGDEVILPAPYWTTYPEAIRLAGGVPVEVFAGATRSTWSRSSSSRPRAPRAPRRCCSARRPTRPARSTPPSRPRRSARWALEHGIWVITDEIYEHLVYDDAVATPIVRAVPELADTMHRPQRRGQDLRDDRMARGLDDRPADVIKAATNLQSHLTSNVANVAQRAALAARRPGT